MHGDRVKAVIDRDIARERIVDTFLRLDRQLTLVSRERPWRSAAISPRNRHIALARDPQNDRNGRVWPAGLQA
jgi:hypothetical protein